MTASPSRIAVSSMPGGGALTDRGDPAVDGAGEQPVERLLPLCRPRVALEEQPLERAQLR